MTKNSLIKAKDRVTVDNRHDKIRVHSLGGFSSSPQTPAFGTKHFKCALTSNQSLSRACNHVHKDIKQTLLPEAPRGFTEANKHSQNELHSSYEHVVYFSLCVS